MEVARASQAAMMSGSGMKHSKMHQQLRARWDALWCGDYLRGEQLPLGDAHRHRRLAFDIGFHDGSDSIHFLQRGYDVVAVEANAKLAARASKRPVISRALESGQLRLVVKAIARHRTSKNVTFYVPTSGADFTSTFFVAQKDADAAHTKAVNRQYDEVSVPLVTCAQLMRQVGTPEYTKVDIEGADKYCFQSLLDSKHGRRHSGGGGGGGGGSGGGGSSGVSALPTYVSTEDPSLLGMLERLGYSQFKLVDQTLARAGFTQFSGGLPEDALAFDPDPALNNRRTSWKSSRELRSALLWLQRSANATCAPPVFGQGEHAWGPCRVERCMYVEKAVELSAISLEQATQCVHNKRGENGKCILKSCVPRQREYDLHAKA